MIPIRVIVKKVSHCDINSIGRFARYSNILNQEVQTTKGFINSESFWEYSNEQSKKTCENVIYTISEWNSITDWDNWLKSSQRQKLKTYYNDILHKETYKILIKNRDRLDTFLL